MKSITIVLFALLLLNLQTMACRCSGPSNIEDSFKNAKVVVTGKVVEISYVPIEETFNPDSLSSIKEKVSESKLSLPVKKIVLEVKSVFKNSNISPNTRITIYTPPRSASCGFAFEVNKSYLIYGLSNSLLYHYILRLKADNLVASNEFWTNHCGRTTQITSYTNTELAQLHELKIQY